MSGLENVHMGVPGVLPLPMWIPPPFLSWELHPVLKAWGVSPLQEALPRSGEQEDPRGQRLRGKAVSGASLQLLGGSPRPTGPTPAPQRQHWFRVEGPTPLK